MEKRKINARRLASYWTIGNNVRKFRMKKGLTQEQLAEKASLSPKGIQKVEAGQSGIYLETFIKIAAALEISLDILADMQVMDEKQKCQQEAFYFLVQDKSIEEISFAVELIDSVFKLRSKYLL